MCKEYHAYTQVGKQPESDTISGSGEGKKLTKNMEEIIKLECECKLAQNALVCQANKIKEEYHHLKECYQNVVLFKDLINQKFSDMSM